jgi:hypothetical protein
MDFLNSPPSSFHYPKYDIVVLKYIDNEASYWNISNFFLIKSRMNLDVDQFYFFVVGGKLQYICLVPYFHL